MTKRTKNAWGRPVDETKRDAFKRPITEPVARNAWGTPLKEVKRNAWGRVISETPKPATKPKPAAATAQPTVKRPAPPAVSSFSCGPDGARTILNDGKARTLVRGDGSKVLLSEGRSLVVLEESSRLKLLPVVAG